MSKQLRRCTVDGMDGYFHGWHVDSVAISSPRLEKDEITTTTIAIVELENGEIRKANALKLRFLDKPGGVSRRRAVKIPALEQRQAGKALWGIAANLFQRGFCPNLYYNRDGCDICGECVHCIMDWLTAAEPQKASQRNKPQNAQ